MLAILAIMAAIAVPRLGGINDRWLLEKAAWGLAADMRLARQVAITTGKYTRMEFRWKAREYQMRLPVEKTVVKLPEGIVYARNNFPGSEEVRKLSFSSLGAPSQGGTVGFKTGSGLKRYVILTPATGRVRVSPEPPEGDY